MITGISILYLTLLLYLYYGIITHKFFVAAGRKSWEAFVPLYNFWVTLKIIDRPWWWILLLLLPVVGNVMLIIIIYELLHVFRYSKIKHTLLTIVTLGLYLGYLNYTARLKYEGRDFKEIRKNVSELVASIFFAIVAATVIRAYTFEAFVIPTPSMEKSLMVGDFLFVSKMHYGSRLPITPLALPLVHNTVPLLNATSYTDLIQMPIWRLPGFTEVKRNDPFVFNYPVQSERPIDMRDHYVKRCLATPGDSLQIIDRKVYINGKPNDVPDRAVKQTSYYVRTNGVNFNSKLLKKKFDINYLKSDESGVNDVNLISRDGREFIITIAVDQVEEFSQQPNVQEVIPMNSPISPKDIPENTPPTLQKVYTSIPDFKPNRNLFPNSRHDDRLMFKWTRDNYGPIYMPREGDEVELTPKNLKLYQRIITVYEHNELEQKQGKVFINGKPATHYRFKQNYYWAMGDNRHNSLDSRYWGYVPEDHIVGKPVFIWMSYDRYQGIKGLRTDRIFTTVNGDGKRFSYFWPFVIVVAGITLYNRRRRKKKDKPAA